MAEVLQNNKKAIVIGASSGIGRAVAKILAENGYTVGLTARRTKLLEQLQKEISTKTYVKWIDISKQQQAMGILTELIAEMGGMDLIVINSGINTHNIALDWQGEIDTIDVNTAGFAAMANVALKHFLAQKSGHLVGVSSIAGLRSSPNCSYSASKAFVSNYLRGLRYRLAGSNIAVTDLCPGFVDTEMIKDQKFLFWVASPEGAARQILRAIQKKKSFAFITRRWRIIAGLVNFVPESIYGWVYKKIENINRYD
ncbi:SDR family NAD(P)-dependent oxidoreductase [Candidatus Omnitrophota bacterium]